MRLSLVALVLAGCAARHTEVSTGPTPPPSRRLLVAQLDDELSTRGCERTRFTARVVAPPEHRGEPVRGRVTRCEAGYAATPARLELAVDTPNARVTAVPLEPLARSPDSEPQRNGAVGGTVVGAVLMGLPGAFIGYTVGKTAGIGKEVASDRQHVRIPKGALLTLEKR